LGELEFAVMKAWSTAPGARAESNVIRFDEKRAQAEKRRAREEGR
jgi:hypothetical protein